MDAGSGTAWCDWEAVFKLGEAEDGGVVEFNNKLSESCGMQGAPRPVRGFQLNSSSKVPRWRASGSYRR